MEDSAKFCPSCGTAVAGVPAAASTAKPAVKSAAKSEEARWETRSISVAMGTEQLFIQRYEAFGWEVYSTQDVKFASSHLEENAGYISQVTERQEYTKLTIRRNKNLPHYKEIKEIEDRYEAAEAAIVFPKKPGCGLGIGGAIAAVFTWSGFQVAADKIKSGVLVDIIISVILCGILILASGGSIIGYFVSWSDYNKEQSKAEKNAKECRRIMDECLDEVKKYLN